MEVKWKEEKEEKEEEEEEEEEEMERVSEKVKTKNSTRKGSVKIGQINKRKKKEK